MLKITRDNLSICALISLAVFCGYKFGYAHNITQSLPYKHFFIIKTKNIKIGNYILFKAPKSSIYSGMHLIKQVVAGYGDKITVKDRDVFINQKIICIAKTHAKTGRTLIITNIGKIPEGHYFVANAHTDSYDSRYLDFGLINEKDIIGVAFAMW